MKKTHYQPIVKDKRYWEEIKKGNFNIPAEWLEGGERGCIDRIAIISEDIKEPGSLLDIGANIGFISHSMASLGNKVTAVENDVHVNVKKFINKSSIETGKSLNKKYGLDVEFVNADFIKYLKEANRSWDYTLFLSVFHHLFIGYGYSENNKFSPADTVAVLQLIASRTDKVMYFEMDENVGEEFGWGKADVAKNLLMYTDFDQIDKLTESKDGWKTPRSVYRCSRSGKSKRGDFGKLINLSESRRNKVGCVKGESLFVSREVVDWNENHLYNVKIDRGKQLLDDSILKKLKDAPHPNVVKVFGYSKDWVELEYVKGKLLSADSPFLFEAAQKDFISDEITVEDLLDFAAQAKAGLEHLHKIGIAHTDLTSFNAMIRDKKQLVIIDVNGAVKASKSLIELDWEVFVRYFIGSLVQRYKYKYINEKSDEKMKYSLLERDSAFSQVKKEIESLQEKNGQLSAELSAKSEELARIYNSRSWKILKVYQKLRRK